ncbi:SpoVR family protein [Kyrpidia sp.]|uniref:SpoVR family protein n=1 Tax=Kyrpidia sp. TaxID=2073077 RepID=UPI002590D68F|nr:SpoVR family protein [Kyrpidia sp.]MCL6576996.1 SpoVR family protein [Kyrpidia sp.]
MSLSALERSRLETAIERITETALNLGLQPFPMRYEITPVDVLYTIGAYGMPTRFSHWSFGKAFYRMKMQYDLGLSKIYELVINTNPCYAFLLDTNTLVQNELIVAHVLGHSDFFRNNAYFQRTPRDMVNRMAAAADRIRQYEREFGTEAVESFLDAALAIQEHIDPSHFSNPGQEKDLSEGTKGPGPYDDLWALDREPMVDEKEEALRTVMRQIKERADARKRGKRPEKDLLMFLMDNSPVLEDWQRDVLTIVRQEMLYFWPQLETKIINEGWATFWHLRIMREFDLDPAESFEFAKLHAGVVAPSPVQVNPYAVGLAILEDIDNRLGREALFEVREIESDQSLLRNYLTKEIVDRLDLYLYQRVGSEYRVVDKDWEAVRDRLITARNNGGFPYIVVIDGDHENRGELYLRHEFEGAELDLKYVEKTLPYVHALWGRPVHLETVVDGLRVQFTCQEDRVTRRFL